MKEFILANWETVLGIATLIIGSFGVVSASFKKAKKEVLEVVKSYKEAMEDGKITEEEALKLADELGEALESSLKFWYLLVGIFKKKK